MVRNGLMWCVFLKVEWKGHGDGYRLSEKTGGVVSVRAKSSVLHLASWW